MVSENGRRQLRAVDPTLGPPDVLGDAFSRLGSSDRLSSRMVAAGGLGVAVWWLGVHGGAGETTLEEIFNGSSGCGHAWPLTAVGAAPARVVLVARTNARGLLAAQSAIAQSHEDALPVALLGLVLIADAPGRAPRVVRDLAGVIGGGVPRVWWLPWVQAWRVGEVPSPANSPKQARRLLADLRAVLRA